MRRLGLRAVSFEIFGWGEIAEGLMGSMVLYNEVLERP
jgi:hypothetical protein